MCNENRINFIPTMTPKISKRFCEIPRRKWNTQKHTFLSEIHWITLEKHCKALNVFLMELSYNKICLIKCPKEHYHQDSVSGECHSQSFSFPDCDERDIMVSLWWVLSDWTWFTVELLHLIRALSHILSFYIFSMKKNIIRLLDFVGIYIKGKYRLRHDNDKIKIMKRLLKKIKL